MHEGVLGTPVFRLHLVMFCVITTNIWWEISKTIQYPHTLKSNIYHWGNEGPPLFFHPDTNPVIANALVHPVDKTHVLVVIMELIWLLFLNTLSFNFVPTPRKSLRFTRFRRSYVNHPVVVLTNYCQSYTAFLLGVCYSKWPRSLMIVNLCCSAYLLLECC